MTEDFKGKRSGRNYRYYGPDTRRTYLGKGGYVVRLPKNPVRAKSILLDIADDDILD
jgi:hypothetical protein